MVWCKIHDDAGDCDECGRGCSSCAAAALNRDAAHPNGTLYDYDAGWDASERGHPRDDTQSVAWLNGWDYWRTIDERDRLVAEVAALRDEVVELRRGWVWSEAERKALLEERRKGVVPRSVIAERDNLTAENAQLRADVARLTVAVESAESLAQFHKHACENAREECDRAYVAAKDTADLQLAERNKLNLLAAQAHAERDDMTARRNTLAKQLDALCSLVFGDPTDTHNDLAALQPAIERVTADLRDAEESLSEADGNYNRVARERDDARAAAEQAAVGARWWAAEQVREQTYYCDRVLCAEARADVASRIERGPQKAGE